MPVRMTARLVPRFAWTTASIDVSVDGADVLRTKGVFKAVGRHGETFQMTGAEHKAVVSWGKASIRSFPVNLSIDGVAVMESRVRVENWMLGLWPWALALVVAAWCLKP
jgi:hypothetical protein